MIIDKKEGIKLNIDDAFSFAFIGILRAKSYIALALNPKNKIEANSWEILDNICLLPNAKDSAEVLIKDFKLFIVHNALCEMMENFELTLEEVYKTLLIIKFSNNEEEILYSEIENMTAFFKNEIFETRLKKIKNILNKRSNRYTFWKHLKYVRNCITHNLAEVNLGDIKLNIPNVITTFKEEGSKKTYKINPEENINIKPNKTSIQVSIEVVNIEKTFKIGDTINFSNREIAFILFSMWQSVIEFRAMVLEYIKEQGVPVYKETAI